ncbi:hypothetical protein ACFYNO_37390 [Kitasatospora sp. NPDC006697]|uniref:hypothetical protein n=1 Tax=Kitasatospora sp. NPDC006697 TaxID=3364020 RepID=UPI00367DF73F
MANLRRSVPGLALTGLLASAAALAPAAAAQSPVQDPIPVRPDTAFQGLVNGAAANAAIQLGCFGPITPGQTGHPLAGQTVEADAVTPVSTVAGYTGSAGTAIEVTITTSSAGSIQLVGKLGSFFAPLAIPTSLVLPCTGTAQVTFTPIPTSPTARPSVVTAALLSQP